VPVSEQPAQLVIGVVAHRDLVDAEQPALRGTVRALLERLRRDYPGTPLRLLCALAEGGDLLVAEVARELRIPLTAPLPMPLPDYERDFSDPATLARFRALIADADVLELPLAPGDTAAGLASKPVRDRQYAQLGLFISSHCQILLALWDGRPTDAPGGTGQVLHFHLHEELPGLRRASDAPNLFADDDSDLVYHVVCSRRGETPSTKAGDAWWLTAESRVPGDGPVPNGYDRMFRQMAAFNADLARYRMRIDRARTTLLPARPPASPTAVALRIDRLFATADWLAVHFQRRVHQSLLAIHVLAVLMGLSFLAYSELDASKWFIAVFLGLFALGFALWRIGESRQWHRRYLDYRVLAEGLRVQFHLALAGAANRDSPSFAYDSFLQKQDIELGWIRHVMRMPSLYGNPGERPHPAWLDWVMQHWVGSRESGQFDYFRHRADERARHYLRTRKVGHACLALGLLTAVALLAFNPWIDEPLEGWLLVLMGMLPLIAGVREAYSHKKADKELIKQYRFMARIYGNARQRLDRARDDDERRRILQALGAAALEEHAEWTLLHRDRPLEHSQLG
jgi:hypothetical protein